MRVELHPEAQAELRRAAIWYDEQRPGLGDDLVAAGTATVTSIGETPDIFPRWPHIERTLPIRRALVDGFPYAVAFEVHPDHALILAFADLKRRPLYWLARATPSDHRGGFESQSGSRP